MVLALAALVAALAAWQGAAMGAITVTNATLNGVTSTSTPPGGVFKAEVTASVSHGSSWKSTEGRIGSDAACADHNNYGSGTHSTSFNLTAPGSPGLYDAGFTASGSNSCGSPTSAEKVLSDAVRVTKPGPNPNLPPRCGINVMLVLDKSGSIQSSGQTETVRDATRAFLNALSGTGAKVSITDFSSTASRAIDYTTVTSQTIQGVFEPYLVHNYKPSGYTNWEAAFARVREANTQGTLADLVVFITDGDPTAYTEAGGHVVTGLTDGDAKALRLAATEADLVKAQGSHVFALGVGAAVTKPASAHRLTAISGFHQYPNADFAEADYTLVDDFDKLAQALRQIATELCQASVTITKLVDEGDGVYRPDPGWTFSADVSMSSGSYKWLQPPPPPSTGTRTEVTDDDGVATFQWKPTNAQASSTVTIDEVAKPGYEFVDATCSTNEPGVTRRRVTRDRTPGDTTGTLRPGEYARCTVRNRINPGTIEIEKRATPQGDQAFPFVGSDPLGAFSLVDDAGGTSSSRTFTGLAPGTYTVQELVPPDWTLDGVTCTDPSVVMAGPLVTIALAPGGSVVCTYQDHRNDQPPPPEPPPPTPPPVVPPKPPDPPTPPPRTVLTVKKTAPRVARFGQKVAFSLRVTNRGPITARRVLLRDLPPGTLRLTSLRASGKPRVVRGHALWRLGNLAPGQSRVIRGTVRLSSGTPGLKRNIAVAAGINTFVAHSVADTRILARRRAIPVTG
jgi:uncharacterized repeat protein (TIGR01451 family)